tara:strand:- start:70 stop:738 length:669 start_codon:yes stop_codon:yes gene_type:complete
MFHQNNKTDKKIDKIDEKIDEKIDKIHVKIDNENDNENNKEVDILNDKLKNQGNIKNEENTKKTDNCQELKNIAYKTMLQNGNNIMPETKNISNDQKISSFLENESYANKQESWTKLNKTQKFLRLNNFVDNILREKYNLSESECKTCKVYLQKCIDRKNLQKTKEVTYNKQDNFIENIPYLQFVETSRSFILRKDDKHISTLKCLPPDKKTKVKTLKIHED